MTAVEAGDAVSLLGTMEQAMMCPYLVHGRLAVSLHGIAAVLDFLKFSSSLPSVRTSQGRVFSNV